MKTAICSLESVSPYSQSKHYSKSMVPELEKEGRDMYELRTWRNRMHVSPDGHVMIPPMAFKNCISEAAKYLSMSIPGKGKATYTKHFEAGVLVLEPLVLPDKAATVQGETYFVPSDGHRGGGKRVERTFPVIPSWTGNVPFLIFDETITQDVFTKVLSEAGMFIGIGRFRPRNNGFYGRFKVNSVTWK